MGLIGGSIARALKAKNPEVLVIAYNRTESVLEKAMSDGVIDHYSKKINESFSACDIIFICVPVAEADKIAAQLKKYASGGAIVTDVGSTKSDICKTMRSYKDFFTFIGGHPMAGSEQSGYDASKHYLFENAHYILTPYEDTPKEKTQELRSLIETMGALPLIMKPNEHDFIAAAISHAPHAVAMALVNAVLGACGNSEAALSLASGGFKDITRIASSSPKMWNDISFQNKDNILKILNDFKTVISEYEKSLSGGNERDVYGMFDSAKTFRDKFAHARPRGNRNVLTVDLEDKPGGIAFITTALAYNGINIKNIGILNNRDFENGILEIVVESGADKQKSEEILRNNGFIIAAQ